MSGSDVVIVSAARTPFGKFGGSFIQTTAVELGAKAIRRSLDAINLTSNMVSHVFMGTVYPGGLGQVPARQAAFQAGIPKTVISVGIDKACCSATEAIIQGVRLLRMNEAEIVVCGGMENMSQIPFLQKDMRWGNKMGNVTFSDYMLEGLTWPVTCTHMGSYTEQAAQMKDITREEQDEYAFSSQMRWKEAWEKGYFADEVFPILIKKSKKEEWLEHDEHPRPDTNRERLASLPGAFSANGHVTAGNSSGICDGAASMVLTTRQKAVKLGLKPLAAIKGYAQVGGNPEEMASTPAWAITSLLSKQMLTVKDIDLFEINEAFAAVTLIAMKELGIPREKTNVNGGSISLGHPVGVTGARIVMTLMYELRRSSKKLGVAALCGAGAQGDAILIEAET